MGEKAVFLDRDGTLIEDPGYLNNVEMVRLLPGVGEALSRLKRLGYKLVVVSNQSGVARGIIREEVLAQITDRMRQLLGNEGAYLDGVYYCLCHPDGAIERYRKDSDDRKPMPGMLLRAAKEMDIDLSRSWAIGDSYRDVEAGWRAGCRTILLNSPPELKKPGPNDVRPDFEAVNMKEAANIIHRQETIAREAALRPGPAPSVEIGIHEVEKAQAISETQISGAAPMKEDAVALGGQQVAAVAAKDSEVQSPAARQRTEELLEEAVKHLKGIHQQGLFEEFSALKLVAGVLQMLVVFCAVMAGWMWIGSTALNQGVFVALGFGILLQLMALTLYISSK